MVHILTTQCGLAPGIDDRLWVFPAAVSAGDLGSGAGFLFPCLTCGRKGSHPRWHYDPAMDWSARAATHSHYNQIQNAVAEVFGLSRELADAYGTRSMRCGGLWR